MSLPQKSWCVHIAAFCAFLLAVAFAAPVAEETSPQPDAKELIEKANPVENDISAPRTDLPPNEEKPVEEQTTNSETVDTNEEKVEIPVKQEETLTNAETDNEKTAEDIPVEATPSEDEASALASNNENEMAVGSPYEGLVPVHEVIPPPEVAFVLGEYADESIPTDETKYQVVQGETEEGMPVLSEYAPDEETIFFSFDENTDDTVLPIAEAAVHDYPPAEIIPGVDFNENESGMEEVNSFNPDMAPDMSPDMGFDMTPDMASDMGLDMTPDMAPDMGLDMAPDMAPDMGHDMAPDMGHDMAPDMTTDHDVTYGDSMPFDISEDADGSISDYDYPQDSTFVGPLDYSTDYPHDFLDDDTPDDEPIDGPMMNVDHSAVDYPDQPSMEDAFHRPDVSKMNLNLDNIVAGLEVQYHPDPISGFGPHADEQNFHGPEVNYPVYTDQPIIPGAMLNTNPPVAESVHNVDTPVPERVPMDDLSESNTIMTRDDISDNEFIDTNAIVSVSDDTDIPNNNGFQFDHSMGNPDFDDKPDIVIELNVDNQEASVNGRPFEMSQAKNILNFIEELISRATFSRRPMMDETNDDFNTESDFPAPYMPMNDFPNRFMGPPFSHPYPLYGDMNNYRNSYYPVSNEFDYNPYGPFFNPRFNRGMNPTFDNMPDNMYRGRFGFESPRDRRFAFNPMWH
ncbi:hypothetical protein FHG87_013947 [Trinorchestia longiramus]|nr:hypothetical protein FHG87_013947 [Trinorchestia longiramus]